MGFSGFGRDFRSAAAQAGGSCTACGATAAVYFSGRFSARRPLRVVFWRWCSDEAQLSAKRHPRMRVISPSPEPLLKLGRAFAETWAIHTSHHDYHTCGWTVDHPLFDGSGKTPVANLNA
eukprot:365032-Chlamydomonas_euryale.AAC.15